MNDWQKGFLGGLTMLIIVVLVGIFTDFGAGPEPRVPIRELVKPTRPPHPASIYTPPGWEKLP